MLDGLDRIDCVESLPGAEGYALEASGDTWLARYGRADKAAHQAAELVRAHPDLRTPVSLETARHHLRRSQGQHGALW